MTSNQKNIRSIADKEKRFVAMTTVLAAVILTSMEIVVELLTGSLGILVDAALSGSDLVAAGVTYSLSVYPPDQPTRTTLTVTARSGTTFALKS